MSKSPPRRRRGPARWMTVRTGLALVAAVSITALLAALAVNTLPSWERFQGLRGDSATGELGGEASLPLFVAAQQERTAVAVYLTDPSPRHREALEEARAQTDAGAEEFTRLSGSELEENHRHKWEFVERVYDRLEDLDEVRERADAGGGATGTVQTAEVTDYYTELLATMIQLYQALSAMDDGDLVLQTRPLVGLFWASEGLAQQDTVIAQALAAGRMTEDQREEFAAAYGAQRVMYERWIAPYLPPSEARTYQEIIESDAWQTKEDVERAVLSAPASTGDMEQLPPETDQWPEAYGQVAEQIAGLNLARTQGLLADGYERADQVRTQVLWYTVIGLAAIAVIATLIVTITRSIARRLEALRASAERTAKQLPEVVESVRGGEHLTPAQLGRAGEPEARGDEFGRVQAALTATEQVALRLAAEQAGERQGLSRFVGITASRGLAPLETMLDRTEELQRTHERDVPLVRDLVGVERLALMLRRLLDDQLTLAGEEPHQPYTEPKPLVDLIDDAAAESAESERVRNRVRSDVAILPQAVNDLMHVVSALLDNALRFSAQEVTVTSLAPVHGTAVEIVDLGTGMSDEDFEEANDRLENPQSFGAIAQGDGRLGLFVVAQLAARHGLRVRLRPSDYGGVKAVVLLPHAVHVPFASAPETVRAHSPSVPAPRPVGAGVPATAALPASPASGPLPRRSGAATVTADSPAPPPRPATPSHDAEPATAPEPAAPPPRSPSSTAPSATPDQPSPANGAGPPPLPRRAAGRHMAPELATAPTAPRPAHGTDDRDPDEVGADWSAWQEGIDTAETPLLSADTPTHRKEDT